MEKVEMIKYCFCPLCPSVVRIFIVAYVELMLLLLLVAAFIVAEHLFT